MCVCTYCACTILQVYYSSPSTLQLYETVQLVLRGALSNTPGSMGHQAVGRMRLLQSQALAIKVMSFDKNRFH